MILGIFHCALQTVRDAEKCLVHVHLTQCFLQIAWSFESDGSASALYTISERVFIDGL